MKNILVIFLSLLLPFSVFAQDNFGIVLQENYVNNSGEAAGPIYLTDGSVGSPSLSFINDTDTGIYRITSNAMGFSANGVLRLRIDANETIAYGIIRFLDGIRLNFGSSADVSMLYSTTQTPDALVLGLSADSNALILAQVADVGVDFAFADLGTPALVIQNADATDTDKRGWIYHDGTNFEIDSGKGETLIDDNLTINGSLTYTAVIRNLFLPVSSAALGPTAPSDITVGTFRCKQFNQAQTSQEAFITIPITADWDAVSDYTIGFSWYQESGDPLADGEVVEWDLTYRSIAVGEAYDNGTAATASITHTQSGAGTDKAGIFTTVSLPYNTGNQPIAKFDGIGININLDETATTYSGDPILCAIVPLYNSVSLDQSPPGP